MSVDPGNLPASTREFLQERHLATLTTLRGDGSPHVVPVGFSYDVDARLVRIITFPGSVKVRNAERGGRAVVSQVDGGRWLSLEGIIVATQDPTRVAAAVEGYSSRYQEPGERNDRVALEISVDRILGRA
ncbi:MAG: TIGR03618 family F420-dependent PPOX class oxidoreductase [Microthrixaceae bacterium]